MSSCSASTLCVPHKTKTYVKSQMKHDLNGSRLCGSSSNVETAFYAVRAEINSMCDHGEDVHTLAGQQTQTQRVRVDVSEAAQDLNFFDDHVQHIDSHVFVTHAN
mmetsp:Transcript_5162/g.14834  ORF Transcript_5162/g.14834 Transcript_5162/m.14834 type:complete len:105 (-) Transcript_5162:282-596(-)